MNKQKLSEMKYKRVRLRPISRRIDEIESVELEPIDDVWLIVDSSPEQLTLRNPRSEQYVQIGTDHIREYITDPGRSDGILHLKSQVFLFRKRLPQLEPLMRS
jgi:hypothetical protein